MRNVLLSCAVCGTEAWSLHILKSDCYACALNLHVSKDGAPRSILALFDEDGYSLFHRVTGFMAILCANLCVAIIVTSCVLVATEATA